ncbi:MAG TPA: BatA domain-containing protein [Thermomicrobiales bacterium]|nr:BatA domain-containing protein [Thermomicrobiales bacterium]
MPGGLAILAPIGLLALLAVAAIVLIHMRQRTPPVIHLPSLRFWEPVREDSLDRRRLRRPPITLPLILQVMAALLLAFALARPAMDAIPGIASQRTTPEHVIVLLDGSTSMLATTEATNSTTHWDLARRQAVSILDDWQAGDVVTVIVTGSRLQTSSASTRIQRDDLRNQIASSSAPGGVADVDQALKLAASLVLPDRDNRVVVITDGALRPNPAVAATIPAPIDLWMVGSGDDQPNVAVTSIGYRPVANQDQVWRLSFEISAYTTDPVRLPYRVIADGADVVSSEIDVAPDEPRSIEVTLPPGAALAEVVIDVRDVFTADNTASLLLGDATSAGLDVLLISDTPGILERALTALPDARVDTFPATTPGIRALAAGYDLTVFQGIAPASDDIPETPMVFVRPSPMDDRFTMSGVMSAPSVDRFAAGSPVLDGVDLAGVTFGETPAYVLAPDEEELVRGTSNELTGPLVWRGEMEGERYVVLGFDLSTSNISQRVAFPVLIARAVADVATASIPGVLDIGAPLVYPVSDLAASVEVTSPDQAVTSLAVLGNSTLFEDTGMPGIYAVREYGEARNLLSETVFVINAGHPTESDLFANPDLASALQGGSAQAPVDEGATGVAELWPLLAGVAVLLVAAEWLAYHGLRLPRWKPPQRRGGVA